MEQTSYEKLQRKQLDNKRRGPMEIRFDLIEALQEESMLTRLCYKVNLAPTHCRNILDELVLKGLVAIEKGKNNRNLKRFVLTNQGFAMLALWMKINNMRF